MKIDKNIFIAVALTLILIGCKKDKVNMLDGGAINVTNAVVGGSTLTLFANQSIVSGNNNTVALNSSTIMQISSRETQLNLGVPATPATGSAAAIPAVTYYNQPISINYQSNYSLFLTGTSPSSVESVLIKETYPYNYTDSVCAVRFINLAPGSNPISINIWGSNYGSEVNNLAYKNFSDFKKYPAKKANNTLLFEIRDATTGKLLFPIADATKNTGNGYALAIPRFHNVTLCYRGTGTNVGIILNNDY